GSDLGPIVRIDGSIDFADLDNNAPGPRSFNPQSRSATGTNRVSGDVRIEITPQDHAIRLVAYASREDYNYFEVPAAAVRYQSNNTVTAYRGA
ncbi:TonB-dependent receptor, partial [Escherichia coli]|nr:TonB-dependent receptor [Escherichia coli]